MKKAGGINFILLNPLLIDISRLIGIMGAFRNIELKEFISKSFN
jgi:hypothetical protein